MMNRTQEMSRRPLMNYLYRKMGEWGRGKGGGGGGGGAVSSKSFDLLNSMIYDQRSIPLR